MGHFNALLAPVLLVAVSLGTLGQDPGCNIHIDVTASQPSTQASQPSTQAAHQGHDNDDMNSSGQDESGDENDAGEDQGTNGDHESGDAEDNEVELFATLTSDSGLEASFAYVEDGAKRWLRVEMRHAEHGSVHTLSVNGTDLGTLTANDDGFAAAQFDTSSEPGHTALPDGFAAHLAAGASVQLDSLTGALQAEKP